MSSSGVDITSTFAALKVHGNDMPIGRPDTNTSPFLLEIQDVDNLAQSDGFILLRQHLAQHYTYGLCDEHTPTHVESYTRWLIVRDVLHALLVPVVELFDKAVYVAASATQASKVEDLEYAFTGQARSAFLWLQCFLSSEKEREWCYTRGCPACVVEHSLDSEFTIRLLHTACLLSDVHYPFTIEGPTLPSFMFFLDTLQRAEVADPLWGSEIFELTQPRACATRNGIEELIHQCLELDTFLSRASSPSDPSSAVSSAQASPVLGPIGTRSSAGKAKQKVKRCKIAQRQIKLQFGEEQWTEEMQRRCWDQLQPGDSAVQESTLPIPARCLDAGLKLDATVSVEELRSEG
ncbi:hypothetical protein LTR37_002937 [Vermiconidia calcicola]|uniref:Uncharacterized protein n=1 Tax=Vermiconidia calcicola TaxID=1690605 RepID=A0ACC3NRR9_9PEZI|nr:hypothetical protein LTR37_002937 [Vermiconidia calcicola]